jgi:hypothetical protein
MNGFPAFGAGLSAHVANLHADDERVPEAAT